MANLYPLTEALKKEMPDRFVQVDSHDSADPESPDTLWLEKHPPGGLREGEYIVITPELHESWYVAHNSADLCGGHPTYWSKGGTAAEALSATIKYLTK